MINIIPGHSLFNSTFERQVLKGVVEEACKKADKLTRHDHDIPTELNLLKPISWAPPCFLPPPPLLSAIYTNRCCFGFFRSSILTLLGLCFSFHLLFWSLKRDLLCHKGKVPNPDGLGGNIAGTWTPQKKNSLIKRSLLKGSVQRATRSAPHRALLIYQTSSKGWAGFTRIWEPSFDHWAILTFLTRGSWQGPNSSSQD